MIAIRIAWKTPLLLIAAWSVLVGCSGSLATGQDSPDGDASFAPDAVGDAASSATSDASAEAVYSDASSDASDRGGDATEETTDGDGGTCAACGSGSVCVEDQTSGGALILPDDAGNCPAGQLPVDAGTRGLCQHAPSFHCAVLPSACSTAVGSTAIAHCACAPSLCSGGSMCSDVMPTLVECLLLAP